MTLARERIARLVVGVGARGGVACQDGNDDLTWGGADRPRVKCTMVTLRSDTVLGYTTSDV